MRKLFSLLFSAKTTLLLLLIFTISIAAATFVEDKFDTTTAQLIIYRSWWFELTIALMALNFIGNLRRYNFFSISKIGGLLFHAGFIILIIGAAITRYFSFEGTMHIRQNESSNSFASSDQFLQVNVSGPKGDFQGEKKMDLSAVLNNDFTCKVNSGYEKPVKITFKRYIKNAEEFVNENTAGESDMVALQISSEGVSQGVYLKEGERISSGGISIAFADTTNRNDVSITTENGKLIVRSKNIITGMNMAGGKPDTTQKDTLVELKEKNLFQCKNIMFALVKFYKQAELDFKKNEESEDGIEVLTVNVEHSGQKQKVNLTLASSPDEQPHLVSIGDLKISLRFGPKKYELPFFVQLNQFILDRYPGSMSPSSFASEVTVNDKAANKTFNKRIFMNHVLDYKGFRFFQSSYDMDEKGTILSVNHDFWGTWISYLSYLILLIGFVITMFAKNSRYHLLTMAIKKIREKRKTLTMLFVLLFLGNFMKAQHNDKHVVNMEEAEKLGSILVQTFDGRLEPAHTMAYDVMHKISKKDQFNFDGKGPMDAMQLLIDIIADPEYWKNQKLIYIREKSVSDLIGIDDNYASFNDFLVNGSQYKLSEMIENAFRKNPSQQSRFDKELIKVDERVNLFYTLLQGSTFKIFPVDKSADKWVDWTDSLAKKPLSGAIGILNNDLQLSEFNYSNIFNKYLQELISGTHSGDFSKADKILGYIKNIQQNSKDAKLFPSQSKIAFEIRYNKSNIFKRLSGYYGIISLFLLLFAFTDNLISKKLKWLDVAQKVCISILALLFLYHTYGMFLRWYLSDHAPWSNGYEALLLIAWSTILAGFFFIKNSKIIQAATAFLACMTLMTAGHSSYDPQLTNLQPVLQSYWLVIHVAVITISYGFLSLGFILGVINMFLFLFKNDRNNSKTDLLISELTFINEKNLQIGLFLATLGTFLGGVWASESWGRYWGWDAKETWALVIIIVYSIILHLRLVPQLKSFFIFNVSSILGFGSVLMTFIGVNYYLSKGLHSYASDDKSAFPVWGWIIILSMIIIMIAAGIKEKAMKKKNPDKQNELQ